ncbi:unnamed protein product, partial [Linum tenue]
VGTHSSSQQKKVLEPIPLLQPTILAHQFPLQPTLPRFKLGHPNLSFLSSETM